jgi:methylmalonyl-CoA mutase, N-terminal domain
MALVSAAAGAETYAKRMQMSESGLPIEPVYDAAALAGFDPKTALGEPGEYPYTRGVYPEMYTKRPWTIRQYAGFSTAAESNRRYHQLIANGTTGLSVAFDLPTQMGYDSDAAAAHGEVGKVGVAIDSLADMRALFDGIPLDKVSTSMTINAPAALLLLMYQAVAEEQGAGPRSLSGTIQNDILKEYIARGTYIYPPRPSLRLVADTFAYCRAELPKWNTISISGYHMAEAGATPVQEIAFTLANAKEYVAAALASGLAVDEFAPRLSFFFVARTTLLEEVAKFRAARRMWARIMRDEFKARDPKSQMLRFHTQTAGVQLTAQQKELNLARVTIQALAAVLGGTQSLHTNSYDEAIERGFQKSEIEHSAYEVARETDDGRRVIVGVNKFTSDDEEPYEPLRVDPGIEKAQAERLRELRAGRDQAAVRKTVDAVKSAAEGTDNVLPPVRDALRAGATLGEVCDALRAVWGVYQPPDAG